MGMYNEVFKQCPKCGGQGYMQISQIVLGFGGFNLDNPERIAEELSVEDIGLLKKYVEDEKWFNCRKCNESFKISESPEISNIKIDILNSIGK